MTINSAQRPRWRPRLWMLLTAFGVFAVGAALGGLALVKVYDDQLIRQTESELLAQGAAVAEAYRAELLGLVAEPATYGLVQLEATEELGSGLAPYVPTLRASQVMPAAPEATATGTPADASAHEAGRAVTALLVELRKRTLAGIRVVDPAGVVVASARAESLGTSLSGRAEVERALRGVPTSMLRERTSDTDWSMSSWSRDTAFRVSVAVPVIHQNRVWGAVLLVRTPLTLAKAVYGDRWNLTATLAVLVGVLALVSLGMSAFVVRPIRTLVREVRSIGAGHGVGRAPLGQPVVHELAELSSNLTTMAEQLELRASYIRNFTASVSHEFKTPLSSILGAAELLEESGELLDAEQRTKFLRNIAVDAERLARLVDRLLVLARAEMGAGDVVHSDVGAVLREQAANWAARSLKVAVEVPKTELRAKIPTDALEAALNHLLENAQLHGPKAITVALTATSENGTVVIDVRDDGPGISAANRAHIFNAFFTTARDHGGTGLGLTISQALLRAFRGSLELVAHEGPGAWFRLRVPQG